MLNGIPPRYPVVHLRSATETTNFLAPSLPLSLSIEGTPFSRRYLVSFIDLISRKTGWGGSFVPPIVRRPPLVRKRISQKGTFHSLDPEIIRGPVIVSAFRGKFTGRSVRSLGLSLNVFIGARRETILSLSLLSRGNGNKRPVVSVGRVDKRDGWSKCDG